MTREEYNEKCKLINRAIRERRKAAGQCYSCGAPLPEGNSPGTRCPKCQQKSRDYARKRYLDRLYSGKCVYCGNPLFIEDSDRVACEECARKRYEYKKSRKDLKR